MESFISGSSSSSRPIHVYLSFKGDDETCRFTDRLWAALETDDLNTFWDDKKLEPGDSIFLPPHFLKPIRQSNISIVVFSKNYASSIWCLEELSEIAARINEARYTVFPIFHDVHPCEVQYQSNSFEKSFAKHEQRFAANLRKLQSWRLAMNRVANLSGWHVLQEPGEHVIDDIVIKMKRKMRELAYVDADLVGMKSQVREVEELLELVVKDEVRIVGICGMGGVGKTTLARVLYDRIAHYFNASHFIFNASEFISIARKIRHLRNNILLVIDGIHFRLDLEPVIWFVKSKWFGGGIRIIITSRDEGVLKMFEKYDIYRVKLLGKEEALQLFCTKAFKCDFPKSGYEAKIDSVLQYANGHPLAIVMLGSFLFNIRASDWSNALVQFKMLNNPLLMKVLRESFDDLDDVHAEAFLDIACFFTGKEVKFVEGILQSCDFLECDQIEVLVEKSLITIMDRKIQMHSLLQEMARDIVRDKFPFSPEQWSRLWDFDNIYEVMEMNDHRVTRKVEAIVLELLEDSKGRTLRVEGLSLMSNLRLLIFHNVKFSGVLDRLSRNLKYISWHQYPYISLPSSFEPDNLRELILSDSCITSIWNEEKESLHSNEVHEDEDCCLYSQEFPCLRNLNLSGSKDLTTIPDFEEFPSLERLDLERCTKLSQLHPSIAAVSNLKFLNLRNCTNLVSILNQLFCLPSLEILNLACCSKFANCPNFSKNPFSNQLVVKENRSDVDEYLCKCTIC